MEIILRKDAKARGLKQYYTGVPCQNGHLTYRYCQSGTCQGCVADSFKRTTRRTKEIRYNNEFRIDYKEYHPDDIAAVREYALSLKKEREIRDGTYSVEAYQDKVAADRLEHIKAERRRILGIDC